jgi:hypothetical protein
MAVSALYQSSNIICISVFFVIDVIFDDIKGFERNGFYIYLNNIKRWKIFHLI